MKLFNCCKASVVEWMAAVGSVMLLLSVGVSKSGQNLGMGLLLLAFILAGWSTWLWVGRHPLVVLTVLWIGVIALSTWVAVESIGTTFSDQGRELWRFSRFFLIPLLAWGIAVSRLGADRAYLLLFTGFLLGYFYHAGQAGWPLVLVNLGRVEIWEGVQFYGMFSATAILAALIHLGNVRSLDAGQWQRVLLVGFWVMVLMVALNGFAVSQARASFIALSVVLLVYFLGHLITDPRRRGRIDYLLLALFVIITVGGMQQSGIMDRTHQRFERDLSAVISGVDTETGYFEETNLGIRLNQWQSALGVWRDHWFLGVGPDGARYAHAISELPERTARSSQHHFHSIYIDLLLRFGIAGAAVMALFMIQYLRTVRKLHSFWSSPEAQLGSLGLMLFLLAGITQTYWTSQVSWFFLAGLLAPACAAAFQPARNFDT